jgi:hypothetical protein
MPIAWLLDKILTSSHGPLRDDMGLRSQTGKCCRLDSDSPKQVTGIGGGGAYQARPAWFGSAGEPRSGLITGEVPGPAVLGGPPQAKAPPAHSPMPCAWGVEMSLLCPPGGPTGAHSLIYQANPLGRPARKATADFSHPSWVRRARSFLR